MVILSLELFAVLGAGSCTAVPRCCSLRLTLTSQEPARLSRGHERVSFLRFLNLEGQARVCRIFQAGVANIRTRECGRARRCGEETDRGRKKGREVGRCCRQSMGKGPGPSRGRGCKVGGCRRDIQISVGREGSWGS
ncbi:hypothetical protein B0H65DRAFT_201368 [Neurospora tetraspora]|uniref:Secreted protein n=1 Tax=Neurospora tetraspora TaxID=94610 RepID=A0AAE0JFR6_9PEZI|nr:hypothetical protein B0H65DRAFT_201368 [Neurospora tetraspora]